MNVSHADTLQQKHQRLKGLIAEMQSVVVAFSGGVDSTLVLKVALNVLGRDKVLAATGVSPSLPQRELESVKQLASVMNAPLELVDTDEINNPAYSANSPNRCYHCKTELYTRLTALAKQRGFAAVANGVNLDDQGDWRPGITAANEWSVRAPLMEAALAKDEIRILANELGIPNWQKPALACLSSRVSYGTPVTVQILSQIEKAEAFLYQHGFSNFRVRHHGKVARIEVSPDDMQQLLADPLRQEVVSTMKKLGYNYVTLDLQGFRSGSGNELLGGDQ